MKITPITYYWNFTDIDITNCLPKINKDGVDGTFLV